MTSEVELPEEEDEAAGEEPLEEFHLRLTRWGMSLEEVRASEPFPPLRQTSHTLVYATTTLEIPCLLTYLFVQDHLVRARLSFSDPSGRDIPPLSVAQAQRLFLFSREQLRIRYGLPQQRTTYLPRDVSDLRRQALKYDEVARQYDVEIEEAESRMRRQREWLEKRYARWRNRDELVARGLKPYERDLRELREWKREALERAANSRQQIQNQRNADAVRPLVATMSARWPYARGLHDIELLLDCREPVPRLDIRYQATQILPTWKGMDEL